MPIMLNLLSLTLWEIEFYHFEGILEMIELFDFKIALFS
jgi:hypothetical protein